MELRAIKKIIFISFCLIFFLTSSFGVRWIGRAATFLREANSDESSIDKFKDYKYFAASYNFDIGEVVTITNIDTNKSLQVVISDRIKKPTGYMLFFA